MVVVVVIPDADRIAPFVLAVVGAGVETFIGHQSLVALDLPVVAGRVAPGALVASDERAGRATERFGGVVRSVVRDQAGDPRDAVSGEERQGAVEEPDGRRGSLVLERLGVGQAREPVLHRVEVGVADFLLVSALACQRLVAAAAVGPPAATVGDLPDLLHVHVDHVPRVAGDDLARPAQILALGSDVADPIQPEAVQPARHSPHAALNTVPFGELTSDPACGPLLVPSPLLDQLDHPDWQAGGTRRRCAGTVQELGLALGAVAGDPLRQGRPSDAELGSDVGRSEIGRASCRERVWGWVGAGAVKREGAAGGTTA